MGQTLPCDDFHGSVDKYWRLRFLLCRFTSFYYCSTFFSKQFLLGSLAFFVQVHVQVFLPKRDILFLRKRTSDQLMQLSRNGCFLTEDFFGLPLALPRIGLDKNLIF